MKTFKFKEITIPDLHHRHDDDDHDGEGIKSGKGFNWIDF